MRLPSCNSPVVAMWPEVICPLGEKKGGKKTTREIWLYSGGGLFRASFTDRQNIAQHSREKNNGRNLLNMIVQHFPAYNTSVPGYGTKIDVCFSTDTLSRILFGLPFWTKNGATVSVLSSFPAIESGKFQLPMKFRRHFRWRLTQFGLRKGRNEKSKGEKMLKISFRVLHLIQRGCYSFRRRACKFRCLSTNTHKTFFLEKGKKNAQNKIFLILSRFSIGRAWLKRFRITGEF